ncbi:MAG: four helix bundle protein [Chloroflexota bacterium]
MEKPHKKLDAWKLSMDLVIDIYRETEKFPDREQYGIVNQMRRAAISIPSNIAEGAARNTKREFVNYLHIAQASLSELDTQIELAGRLGYMDETSRQIIDKQMERIDKTITGLIRHLSKSENRSVAAV